MFQWIWESKGGRTAHWLGSTGMPGATLCAPPEPVLPGRMSSDCAATHSKLTHSEPTHSKPTHSKPTHSRTLAHWAQGWSCQLGTRAGGSAGLMPPTRLICSLGSCCLICAGVAALAGTAPCQSLPACSRFPQTMGFASFGLIGCFLGVLAIWLVNSYGGLWDTKIGVMWNKSQFPDNLFSGSARLASQPKQAEWSHLKIWVVPGK